MAGRLGFRNSFTKGWKERVFCQGGQLSSQKGEAAKYYSPSKTPGLVCENGLRNVHPHASLAFSLLRAHRAVEMGRPRFTGRVRGFTSSGPPWGQSPVLIWPARKTAVPQRLTVRWSHPNTRGARRLVEPRNVQEGGGGGMEGGHL